jgi:hypothetical protein
MDPAKQDPLIQKEGTNAIFVGPHEDGIPQSVSKIEEQVRMEL